MGLFGDDKAQNLRLDALEAHVRQLTEDVHQNRLDVAALRLDLMRVQGEVDEKISTADVDQDLLDLNAQLKEARQRQEAAEAAAEESWATLQSGARESYATLRASIEEAAARLTRD